MREGEREREREFLKFGISLLHIDKLQGVLLAARKRESEREREREI